MIKLPWMKKPLTLNEVMIEEATRLEKSIIDRNLELIHDRYMRDALIAKQKYITEYLSRDKPSIADTLQVDVSTLIDIVKKSGSYAENPGADSAEGGEART